jgi:cytohesin
MFTLPSPLENLAVRVVAHEKDRHVFELYHPNREALKACKMNSDKALVRGNHESYLIRAATREDMDEWVRCLETNIQCNPLLELINKRKKMAQAAIHAPSAPAPRVEFRELLTAAQLCLAAAKGAEYFRNKFGESAVFSFARAQCFMTSHASTKTHQIVVLSRHDEGDDLRQALLLCKDLAAFKAFSLVEHYQFRQTATDVYNRIKSSLNRDYCTPFLLRLFASPLTLASCSHHDCGALVRGGGGDHAGPAPALCQLEARQAGNVRPATLPLGEGSAGCRRLAAAARD